MSNSIRPIRETIKPIAEGVRQKWLDSDAGKQFLKKPAGQGPFYVTNKSNQVIDIHFSYD
jgi:hypothetical protein